MVKGIFGADDGIWTRDLVLTKDVLYPWATSAKLLSALVLYDIIHKFSIGFPVIIDRMIRFNEPNAGDLTLKMKISDFFQIFCRK